MPIETFREDLGRLAITPEHHEAARSGERDLGQRAVVLGQLVPVRAQPCRIGSKRSQSIRVRRRAQQIRLRGLVDLAFRELIQQRGHLRVAPRLHERAQLESQRRRVRAGIALELRQSRERFRGSALLERKLGLEHQPRHAQARRLRVRTSEQRSRSGEIARLERCTRADQCSESGRMRNRERFLGGLARAAVAPFEQSDQRRILLASRALDMLRLAVLAHLARQPRKARCESQQHVDEREAACSEHDERVERNFEAVRRCDDQHVAGVVDSREQRDRDGDRAKQQEQQQCTHRAIGRRLALERRYRFGRAGVTGGCAVRRSCAAFSVRTASRLAARSGRSSGSGVASI